MDLTISSSLAASESDENAKVLVTTVAIIAARLTMARTRADTDKIFCDAEWQADTFAGTLLMSPRHLGKFTDTDDAARQCGMTGAAAKVMWAKLAKNFTISEISADKGYGSVKNYNAIQRHGAVPYIAFKSIHTGRAEGFWKKMFHYFQFRRDEFLAHYHKRSNVESTFSMIKAKFGDHLRSKTDAAMVNEVLCKSFVTISVA